MKVLSEKELVVLKETLTRFERREERNTAVHWISGGFASAEMFNYDDELVDIELTWGVQSDCENRVHKERFTIPRNVLKDSVPLKKRMLSIKEA